MSNARHLVVVVTIQWSRLLFTQVLKIFSKITAKENIFGERKTPLAIYS